ncbi:hypothetical protein [Paraburkholderia solisilvae]|uniref:Uncharacterized protein n=1 Tax=Paraburkholderia solisilvae TaxID=624376 RepID=A0A6J5D643_9BURK|nr:hypothetical protein [Paraburkholderia solisilvae]CAB3748834.1 hypothetical protein LMG29739_00604 [Paraburkholderia solisilvae]
MNVVEILAQAESAADDHFKYARFVSGAEALQSDARNFTNERMQSEYQACWFELEIVNALALDEWESDGKPDVWLDPWNERYKQDAKELVGKLCSLLSRSV